VPLAVRNADEYSLRPQALSIYAATGGRHARPPFDDDEDLDGMVPPGLEPGIFCSLQARVLTRPRVARRS
jgi:hypothetical protein